jgi:hypothetical protein
MKNSTYLKTTKSEISEKSAEEMKTLFDQIIKDHLAEKNMTNLERVVEKLFG